MNVGETFVSRRELAPRRDLSIAGVKLGMSKALVDEMHEEDWTEGFYRIDDEFLRVKFNEAGQVVRVSGIWLELDGRSVSPRDYREEGYLERLSEQLGEPDFMTPRSAGAFVHFFRYERSQFTVQFGCMGWVFTLGPAEGEFVPYEKK